MKTVLEVRGLEIAYETHDGVVRALNDVDLVLREGLSLGLVGETGAGKTTLAKGIMRLTPMPPGVVKKGEVLYGGKNLLALSDAEMRDIRGKGISMIFQDPMTSLNPVMTVGEQIAEAVAAHTKTSADDARKQARDMLELVGIPEERADEYPHQFSGGMKQRVVIAIALACNPKVLIADEPTTALDVTIQAQVLEMISGLRKRLNTAMLLITHDLGVVAQNCEYVAVIYAGEIVEQGTVREVFKGMRHPYTTGLFTSIPNLGKDVHRLIPIDGLMPDPMDLPKGCKFSTRCAYARDICREEHPKMTDIAGEHRVRCFIQQGLVSREATHG
jgi:peptide/nickel transport system ATP-binding protein